jgi:hypothetical protein
MPLRMVQRLSPGVDGVKSILISDTNNHRILRLAQAGGEGGGWTLHNFAGTGVQGKANGQASEVSGVLSALSTSAISSSVARPT